MAMRRMFSKAITQSARFLRNTASSRLLYYDLGMAADDDGFVEAFSVIRMTAANERDLYELEASGLITIMNDDLVCYINDWAQNNYIQSDRYHPGLYHDLLPCIQDVYKMDTQVRLGKGSKEKCMTGKERTGGKGVGTENPTDLPF